MIRDLAMPELKHGHYCYFINATQDPTEHGGYVPSIVIENESGHYPMTGDPKKHQAPWVFGKTLEQAEKTCDEANKKLGLTDWRVMEIIASSMRGSTRRRRA